MYSIGDARSLRLDRDIMSINYSDFKFIIAPVFEDMCNITENLRHFRKKVDELGTPRSLFC